MALLLLIIYLYYNSSDKFFGFNVISYSLRNKILPISKVGKKVLEAYKKAVLFLHRNG